MRDELMRCCFCNDYVFVDETNRLNFDSFLCNNCEKGTVFEVDNKLLTAKELLDIKLTENFFWINLNNNIKCTFSQEKLAKQIVSYLVSEAFKENSEFSALKDWGNIGIVANHNEYIGYLVWFEGYRSRINQIFIFNKHRRKGYASKFLKNWVENIAILKESFFEVESPNDLARNLLVKLKYTHFEDDKIIGDKFYW